MDDTDRKLPDDPEQLKALLQHEWQQHERERQQHQHVVDEYEQTLAFKERTIRLQERTIAELLGRLRGHKRERVDPNQLTLFDLEELEALADDIDESSAEPDDSSAEPEASLPITDGVVHKPAGGGHGRQKLPDNLKREQIVYELSEAERVCPCCGQLRCEIGRETSEQLEYVPAQVKVIEHVRVKYACSICHENVSIAPKPPQPIAKGLPGPRLLANVVLSKYGDHLPLYRQEDVLARYGIIIRRSTLCGWIAAAADLLEPLYQLMLRQVLASRVLHTDDTQVKLLDPNFTEARTARFWAYIGDAEHPYSVYDFTDSRKRDGPAEFLAGFEGYLQADAYGGYDGIYLDSKGAILEVACWAHCRRYWNNAKSTDSRRAHEALSFIGRLYQLEDVFESLSREARAAARQERSRPILDDFASWLDAQRNVVLPKSPIGQAVTYTTNQWQALGRYCDDGALSIDNNVSERTVKICAIGRKNWLFVASEAGGRRAAILFSLLASCKANQVEPQAYLTDLFRTLPTRTDDDDLTDLLPDRWLTAHPHRRWQIDQLRKHERRREKLRRRQQRQPKKKR